MSDSKPLVDFVALLVLYAGISTVVVLLARRLIEVGPNIRLVCGVVAASCLAWLVFWPTVSAVYSAAEAVLLKARRLLGVPYDIEYENAVFYAIWRALLSTIEITAIWGTGLLGAELVRSAGL